VATSQNDQCTTAPNTLAMPKDGFDHMHGSLDRIDSGECSM
jgi:hypothetical protein